MNKSNVVAIETAGCQAAVDELGRLKAAQAEAKKAALEERQRVEREPRVQSNGNNIRGERSMKERLLTLRTKAGDYRLKSLKDHGTGLEGYRWSAKLYRGERLLGVVNEDATGGPLRIEVRDKQELALLDGYAKQLPDASQYEPTESFIGIDLLKLCEIEQQLKRATKKGAVTLFTLEDEGDTYRTLDVPPADPRIETYLDNKYGKGKWAVLNGMIE